MPGESPESAKEPRFAYVVMSDGVVRERGVACLSELLAMAERIHADAIAVDNVYELAASLGELQRLMNSLSHVPKLVQVTAIGDKTYQLSSLAASLGLGRGKLSPEQSAEICAQLCYMGIGSELVLFESNETRIVVSRGRSPVQGGMSVERYRRNIESRVALKTKEIKNILDSKGIDYDMFISKGSYGIERSVFIVYAPRDRLFGLVKPVHDHDIQVRIELVEKREPSFVPLALQPRRARRIACHLIVGVDPGITTGVAAITLDGDLKLLFSAKELGRGQVIRVLSEVGTPIIVATDTVPPPEYVKKLATMLNASLVTPSRPLTVEEKRRLVSDFMGSSPLRFKVKDTHQRDALAAALYAYTQLRPKIVEAREKVLRLGLDIPVDEVEALVAKGTAIWDAIKQVSRACLVPEQRQNIFKPIEKENTIETLVTKLDDAYKRIRKLESERESLLEKIRVLEEQYNAILNAQSFEIRKSKEIESLKIKVNILTKELDSLKEGRKAMEKRLSELEALLRSAARGEVVLVPRVDDVDSTPSTLHSGVLAVGTLRPDDVGRIREIAKKAKLRAIVCEQPCPQAHAAELASFDIALLSLNEVRPVERVGDVYVFDREELEKAIADKLRRLDGESLKLVQKSLKDILESYRAERAYQARIQVSAD